MQAKNMTTGQATLPAIHTKKEQDTEALGRELAQALKPGDVLALHGELGAGKTCFVRGLAQGLNVQGPVSSPTFTLLNEYPGPLPLYHFDLYRLKSAAELEDLGYEEYFGSQGICVLEWAEKAALLLPEERWDIRFGIVSDRVRQVEIKPPAGRSWP